MQLTAYARGLYRFLRFRGDPIVIGGCERSGTTLLLAILSAHPSVLAIPYETWAFSSGHKAGFDRWDPIRVWRVWKGLGMVPRKLTHERWAEKSPANIFYFRDIIDYFQGAVRCIEIVRDGRDVVTSIHPDSDDPWVPVNRWIEAVTIGLSLAEHPRVFTVKYEDLVSNSATTIEFLYESLGLNIPGCNRESRMEWLAGWRQRAQVNTSENLVGREVESIHSKSIRKWEKRDFPYSDRVEKLLADPRARYLLEEHGYL